jgi:membrane-associated progesterone receptor component
MLTDPKESIDKLEDLSADEWESLREWEVRMDDEDD